MRKTLSIILGAAIAASGITAIAADTDKITVNLNGQEMNFDVNPVIENGRTLVPFRAIFEALDCAVSYSQVPGSGTQLVEARKGDDVININITNGKMDRNGSEISLDTAPKIVDGRTLVPLRAVSEALGCQVDWLDDIKTVTIMNKWGQYAISSGHISKDIKLDSLDIVVAQITCSYPIIDNPNNDEFITNINNSYRKQAEDFIANNEKNFGEQAKEECNEQGIESFSPFYFALTFDVNTNRNGIVSLTTHEYRNANGPHPTELLESHTYDISNRQELKLSDILGTEQDNVDITVYDSFIQYLEQTIPNLTAEDTKQLEEELQNVQWYLTDSSLILYFNQEQIGVYAIGRPQHELKRTENDSKLNSYLADADVDKLNFSLEGNPTTGYTWEVISADTDALDINSEYVQDNTDNGTVCAGGKYNFTVTGKKEGNTSVEIAYMRTFEGSSSVVKAIDYNLYVSKDNKITVISKTESDSAYETVVPSEEPTAAVPSETTNN